MKIFNSAFKSSALIAAVLVLSACGSQSNQSALNGSNAVSSTTFSNPTGSNAYGLPAATEQRVQLGGASGTNPTATLAGFSTSSKLRIKVTPLSAPNLIVSGFTNFVFPYGCLQVTVTVNGITKMTSVLRVEGMAASSTCQNAATSQILDFTGQISGSSNGVSVVVSNPVYDNCRYTWQNYYGCSTSAVWMNHQVAANVQVQVDGTFME